MTRPHPIRFARYDEQFKALLSKLPAEIREAARQAIKDLTLDPYPKKYRLEKQTSEIYTIHVTRNHSHKLSFELAGDTAILRKIGTHKEIDRSP
ncbi:MAG: hypothetical protein Q8O37_00525 [Sulfuricellaceae bacterium]|nr:hypothetical protein [Sulfuricellaceae bacterium]